MLIIRILFMVPDMGIYYYMELAFNAYAILNYILSVILQSWIVILPLCFFFEECGLLKVLKKKQKRMKEIVGMLRIWRLWLKKNRQKIWSKDKKKLLKFHFFLFSDINLYFFKNIFNTKKHNIFYFIGLTTTKIDL